MKTRGPLIAIGGALVLNIALTVYLLATRPSEAPTSNRPAARAKAAPEQSRHLEQSLAALRSELNELQRTLAGTPAEEESENGNGEAITSLTDRLAAMESSIVRLRRAMDGVSLEAASAERAELFKADNGHLKADEYFATEKYAIAGEGYLTFLEAHPDHPDHRSILERARTSFSRAGYTDKAFWAQEELMRIYPETRTQDLRTLSRMEKRAGRYNDAAQHAAEAASREQSSSRYWDLLYAAWYTELGQGPQAGLNYYRTVQEQIIAAGYGDQKLGERARQKIEELERRIASNE